MSNIDHPAHYGGDDPYEVIKVIEAWKVDFHIGNVIKYLYRCDKKSNELEDLKKASWYLNRKIKLLEDEIKNDVLQDEKPGRFTEYLRKTDETVGQIPQSSFGLPL